MPNFPGTPQNSGATANIITGHGTAGTPDSGVVSVQGVASGTAIPVSGTVAVSGTVSTNVAQWGGTNTSLGQKVLASSVPIAIASDQPTAMFSGTVPGTAPSNTVLVGQIYNTSAPTPSNGQTLPFQADSSGRSIVNVGSSVNIGLNAGSNTIGKVDILGNSGATLDATLTAGTAPTNGLASLIQYNTTAPAPTNGQTVSAQSDQAGNALTFNGVALKTLSTQGTAVNAAQTIFNLSGCEAVMVQLTQTSTLTAGAVTFEFTYDGTNFSAVPAECVVDPTSTTFAQISLPYTVQASTNKQFLILMNGAIGLRIRTSTTITGTGSVTPNYALLNYDPLPQVSVIGGSITVSGTPTVNLTQVASTNLGTPQSFGTAPSGVVLGTSSDIYVAGTRARSNQTTTAAGTLDVNIVGTVGTTMSSSNTIPATLYPVTSGGYSTNVQQALTTFTNVKNAAGQFYGFDWYNTTAATAYVFIYNTTGTPTIGSTTNLIYQKGIPAGAGSNVEFSLGIPCSAGITIAVSTSATSSTAPSPGLVLTTLYK
jgi:hypothetical protein